MESIKLVDIPTYTSQQDLVKIRIELGLEIRDKDLLVLAEDVIDYFKLQSIPDETSKIRDYLFTKYKYTDNAILNKLKELLS